MNESIQPTRSGGMTNPPPLENIVVDLFTKLNCHTPVEFRAMAV
ncbi:hypothetical protein [Halobacillus seohaensis]